MLAAGKPASDMTDKVHPDNKARWASLGLPAAVVPHYVWGNGPECIIGFVCREQAASGVASAQRQSDTPRLTESANTQPPVAPPPLALPVVPAGETPPAASPPSSSAPPPQSFKKGEWIDLLALVEPGKDPSIGEWKRDGKALVATGNSTIGMALVLSGSYEVEAKFIRTEGKGGVLFNLPCGDTAARPVIGNKDGGGLGRIDGRPYEKNAAYCPSGKIATGRQYTIGVRVEIGTDVDITVMLDGTQYTHWRGALTALSLINDTHNFHNLRILAFGTDNDVTAVSNGMRLRVLSGDATPVRQLAAAAPVATGRATPPQPGTTPPPTPAQPPPPAAPAALAAAKPYVIPITGALESHALVEAVEKALAEAKKQQATVIIFRLNTPGGRLDVADKLIQMIEGITWARPVAFISGPDKRALSAGAYLCLACEKIFMVPGATMGAATPYTMTYFGPSVSEKFQSAFRARFRALAQARGHSVAVADAMVDRETGVVQVFVDGKPKLVSEAEARRMAQQIKGRFKRGKTVCEAGQILTMTSKEAAEFGVAAGIVADEKELLAKMEMQAGQVAEAKWLPDWVAKTAAERKKAVDLAMQTFLMNMERAETFDQQADQATSAGQRRPLIEKGLAALQEAAKALTELERLAKDEKYDFPVSEDKLGQLKARMEAMYGRMKALR
jgi:ATP-dependent protease ClpP protease subunit